MIIKIILYLILILLILFFKINSIKTINSKDLTNNSFILDVRTEKEIKEKHLLELPFISEDSSKINVEEFIKKHNLNNKETTINILCRSGFRATNVAKKFKKVGYKNIKVIKGGIEQAEKDGIKVGR